VVVEGLVSEVHYVEAIGEHYASSEAYCEFMSRTKAVTGLVVRTDMVPEEEVEDVL
jgi:ATP/ADP translocase